MRLRRLFLDTGYVLALLSQHDPLHKAAVILAPQLRAAREVWVTEAVLLEIANGLSRTNREGAVRFIRSCYVTQNMRVVSVDTTLLQDALSLYEERPDKTWSLTDCISFVAMQNQKLTEALTPDKHFEQAGFRALLLDEH